MVPVSLGDAERQLQLGQGGDLLGKLGDFKLGMEPVAMGQETVVAASNRLLSWLSDKLAYLRPHPSSHERRYLRYLVAMP